VTRAELDGVQGGDVALGGGAAFRRLHAECLEALAEGYSVCCRLPDAVRCLTRLLETAPDQVPGLVRRAAAWDQLGHSQHALEDYRKAVAREGTHFQARLGLADVLVRMKQEKEALGQYEVLHQQQPDNRAVQLGLAHCQRVLGQTAEAQRLLDAVLAEGLQPPHPLDAQVLCERAQLALAAGQLGKARDWLERALQKAPQDRQINYQYLQCLHRLRLPEEARRCEERIQRIDADLVELRQARQRATETPNDPRPRCQAGEVSLRLGQTKQGLRWLYSALQEDPEHGRTHQALARYFEENGNLQMAERHRLAAAKARPEGPP